MKNETTYQTVLGRLIAQKRKEKEIDQEGMARRVGVSRSTWSRIEAGSSALNMDQLAKAVSALDISLGELMLEVDEVVRELRRQNVEVHDSRDQARSAPFGAVGGAAGAGLAAPVAFLGGAVLGGIIATLLAERKKDD
ncbi:MAG: helix-turn-helix transcriptional regulator [Gemmatimonadetes bacterium]|nr:helix-turn-helix transcriptional regulator [Gemmatimonadota bacterium]